MNVVTAAWALARRFKGGVEAAAARIVKNPSTLAKELSGVNGYKFGADDLDALTQAAVADGVPTALEALNLMAANVGAIVVMLPRAADDGADTLKCLAEAAHDFGRFVTGVGAAAADGTVTANELREVERELGALIGRGQACVTRLMALHEAAKPAHLKSVGGGA
jgi:hypothetical protein